MGTSSSKSDTSGSSGKPKDASSSAGEEAKRNARGDAGAVKKASTKPQRACLEDFLLMKTVGKGSFGKVVQVSKCNTCNKERGVAVYTSMVV